jgi:hypothetical protein
MPVTLEQRVSLITEIQTAIALLQAGLREVQRIGGAYDFYHLLMLCLAGGLERLMKAIICLHVLENTGSFPTDVRDWRGSKGHDLERLLSQITDECFSDAYLARIPAARKDIEFLRNDPRLAEIVRVLSRFGRAARYHDLDTILGRTPSTDSPENEWKKLELDLLQEYQDWATLLQIGKVDEAYRRITGEIVRRVETLVRALCRLFTMGGLGDLAKQQTGSIAPFLFLREDQLGQHRY